ncbi:MAG: HDOD domain-containing protein [Gallionella sp.]|nr:HDOD domain-containing protein [Gallionella sp.]
MHAESDTKAAEQVLNGIHLPPCPTSLLAAMKEARSPDADMGRIVRLIGQDVGLSAPMLKLANSPYFGLRNKVSSVQQAVAVLGLRNTVNLLSNVALRANVMPNLTGMDEFWDRSSMTALAASRIAAQVPGMSCDDAYTVSLFHDCGVPVLMQKYPDYLKNVDEMSRISGNTCETENACYSTTHAVVGNLLARNWLLPQNMCRAILHHHDHTIFSSITDQASIEICSWISIVQAAEYIVDSHLDLRNEGWAIWQPLVLKHLQFSGQEFDELHSDIVAVLNGD